MSKDPAVLFYTSDFLTGTAFFSMEERGQYITLLCEQHQLGHIPENHMISICGSHDSPVIKKFTRDDQGNYYNERMREEHEKRVNYCKSRSNNKSGRKPKKSYDNHTNNHMTTHMENENDNGNANKDLIKNIIKYLNIVLGSSYRVNSKNTVSHINARLNEGFLASDFETVIDKKFKEWKGTENEKFLRPDTLFGTKFEIYLNQTGNFNKGQTNGSKSFAQQQWDAYEESSKCPAPELDEMGNISYGNAKNGGGVPLIEGGDQQGTQ